ncbi:unnamed protein product, partial [marine sediment metagenome]
MGGFVDSNQGIRADSGVDFRGSHKGTAQKLLDIPH